MVTGLCIAHVINPINGNHLRWMKAQNPQIISSRFFSQIIRLPWNMLTFDALVINFQGMIAFSLGYKNGYEDGKKLNAPGLVH